jgi:hypothetical protein
MPGSLMTDLELGALKQQVTDTRDDVSEIKSDLKTLIATLDSRYYTRREGRAVSAALTFLVLVATFWDSIKHALKG